MHVAVIRLPHNVFHVPRRNILCHVKYLAIPIALYPNGLHSRVPPDDSQGVDNLCYRSLFELTSTVTLLIHLMHQRTGYAEAKKLSALRPSAPLPRPVGCTARRHATHEMTRARQETHLPAPLHVRMRANEFTNPTRSVRVAPGSVLQSSSHPHSRAVRDGAASGCVPCSHALRTLRVNASCSPRLQAPWMRTTCLVSDKIQNPRSGCLLASHGNHYAVSISAAEPEHPIFRKCDAPARRCRPAVRQTPLHCPACEAHNGSDRAELQARNAL